MVDTSWHTEAHPELRSGPPWVMEEMIAAQPALAERMLASPAPEVEAIAETVAAALGAGRPVTVVGCGTSEHGAHAIAAQIASAVGPARRPLVRARPALTAALDPVHGVCLAVSHDGGTRATTLALEAAARAGARTAVVTHDPSGSVAAAAEVALVTPVHDASWCHTIAYTSALLAGAAIARSVGGTPTEAEVARDVLAGAVAAEGAASVARALADRRIVICAGLGVDHVTARELALKIAEGARIPTLASELETVVHGQLAGHDATDGLVLVAVGGATVELERRVARAGHVARAAAAIGLPVAAILAEPYDRALDAALTPAGRIVLGDLPRTPLAPLLAGAGALQALTLQLAHARGTNPDLIRREEAAYRAAAAAAEDAGDW